MKIRRFYALFFSLVMLLSLSAPALAAEGGEEPEIPVEEPEEEEDLGFHVDAKAALLSSKAVGAAARLTTA